MIPAQTQIEVKLLKMSLFSIAVIFGFLDSGWLTLMLLASARLEELYFSLVIFKIISSKPGLVCRLRCYIREEIFEFSSLDVFLLSPF